MSYGKILQGDLKGGYKCNYGISHLGDSTTGVFRVEVETWRGPPSANYTPITEVFAVSKGLVSGDFLVVPVSYSWYEGLGKPKKSVEYTVQGERVTVKNESGETSSQHMQNIVSEHRETIQNIESSLTIRAFLKERGFDISIEPSGAHRAGGG